MAPILYPKYKPARVAYLAWAVSAVFAVSGVSDLIADSRVNLAKYQSVTASSQAGSYVPDFAVDGIVSNFHAFRSSSGPSWLEVTYGHPITVASAHVYTGVLNATSPNQIHEAFTFQYHDGSTWTDIPGATVTNNDQPEVNVVFAGPVTSDRFRFYSADSGARAIREIAFFPPNPVGGSEQGFPLGTDVTLNLAYQRPSSASSATLNNAYGPGYAQNAFDGYLDNQSRWLASGSEAGEWLEVDLLDEHAVGSAHVFSGFIDPGTEPRQTTQPIENFKLQYLNGTEWIDIPGSVISGNTQVARAITFTEPVVTSRIRLVTTTAFNARIQELLLFPPRAGGYALGREVIDAQPPDTGWNDFADATYRIRITNPDRRLGLINGSAVFTNNAAGSDAVNWQLLLNYRHGSYRVRNVNSGLALALGELSKEPGTQVVGQPYSGLPHQDWLLDIVSTSPLRFRLINVYSGLALEPLDGNDALGTPLAVGVPGDSLLQQWDTALQGPFPKKGIAATQNPARPVSWGSGEAWLENSYGLLGENASWSYSWGRQSRADLPFLASNHTFNPMQWGNFNWDHNANIGPIDRLRRDLQSNPLPAFLMGFNEPDKSGQADLSVAEAITRWPRLQAMNVPLLTPAPASWANGWLADFKAVADARGYRYDAIGVHWYGSPMSGTGPSADGLINQLQNNFNTFGRPVWLTEFGMVDWNQNSSWSHSDNYEFLAEFMWRAESLPWLQRYSVFQFVKGPTDNPNQSAPDRSAAPRSNVRNEDGTLTAFGELYAAWDGVTAVLPNRAYHLHNRGQYRRLLNTGVTAPGNALPENSGIGTQFFLSPTETPGQVRLLSTRDGRPLRFWVGEGGEAGFGQVDLTASSTEWRIVPEQYGRYFIEHVNTGRRLSNSAEGSFTMATAGTNNTNTQWRFINPLEPDPAGPPEPPNGLSATPTSTEILLGWEPIAGAISYTIERSSALTGPWEVQSTGVTGQTWTDSGLPSESEFFYRITATNGYALTSEPSAVIGATTLHPLASYESWASSHFNEVPADQQLPEADADGDGLSNLLEYAFLTSPTSPSASPFRVTASSSSAITIKFPWNRRATGVTWQLRHGNDLSNSAVWPVVDPGTVHQTPEGDVDRIQLNPAMAYPERGFFILEVF